MKIKTGQIVTMTVMVMMIAGIACRLVSPTEETPVPLGTQQPEPTATSAPTVIELQPTAVSEPFQQWRTAADTRGVC